MKNFLLIMCVLFFLSCNNGDIRNANRKSIYVVFLPGMGEYPIPVDCNELKKYTGVISDTFKISHDEYASIRSSLISDNFQKEGKSCDSRLYIKVDSFGVCIGQNHCACNDSGDMTSIDLRVEYLIKWNSGYYNHITREDLHLFDEIKVFGIPSDYVYKMTPLSKPKKDIIAVVLQEE